MNNKKRLLRVVILSIVLAPLLYTVVIKKDTSELYVPRYTPEGYVQKEIPNSVILSENLGIGIKVAYQKENQSIIITTYKKEVNISAACEKNSNERYKNSSLSTLDKKEVCSYTYTEIDQAPMKYYYFVKDGKLVKIIETGKPFLSEVEIENMIRSLEKKKN